MARPAKTGVDYFPHFILSGKTMFTLESQFGNDGYAFWFKLLEILGSQKNLFFDCNIEANWMFLISKTKVDEKTATKVLNLLVKLEAIDKRAWKKKIIWCQKFVDNLKDVFKKRGVSAPDNPVDLEFLSQKCEQTEVSVAESTQSIVKESKVKKSILCKHAYGEFGNVFLSDDEYAKLKERFSDWQKRIEKISAYIKSTGKEYKNHYATILNWANKNGDMPKSRDKPELSEEEKELIRKLRE